MGDDTGAPSGPRAALGEFLETIARPGANLAGLADDEHLVDAGVLDSLAVVQIILWLEQSHGVAMAAAGIDPAGLMTIGGILEALEHGQ